MNFAAARHLLSNIKRLDYGEWGTDCDEWLALLTSYSYIMELVEDPATLERARQAWQRYSREHSAAFDPYDIKTRLRQRQSPKRSRFIIPAAAGVIAAAFILILLMLILRPRDNGFTTSTPSETPTTPASSPTPDPLEVAYAQAAAYDYRQGNAAWTPITHTFNGVPMVLVPAGCFTIGSNDGFDDEKNGNEVCFGEPFWIDQYEVTNAQFGSIGCKTSSSEPDQPRNCVNWFEASAHCESDVRAARLPTEAEWEYAARGPDNLIYPWGNVFIGENAIYRDSPIFGGTKTAPVSSRPDGVSWVGALHMSGNVWEWTSSLYANYPYDASDGREADTGSRTDVFRVLRGGSWFNSNADNLRAPYRNWFNPNSGTNGLGFRCARSYE